jgi:hypothetical protein
MKAILLNRNSIENMVELDSIPPLKVQIVDENNDPVDLTGKTVHLAFSEVTANGKTLKFKKAFVTTAAASGLAEYRWTNTQEEKDLDKAGKFVFDVILQYNDTAAVIIPMASQVGNSSTVTGTSSGTYSGTSNTVYMIEVTTGGAFGAAVLTLTSTGHEAINTTVTPADGSGFPLGTKGVVATFADNGGGNFVLGDKWTVQANAMIPGSRMTLTKESATVTIRARLAT